MQDRLEVERRAADDLQHIAGRRLLLERLGEVAVPGLELREQADVLDGDDGLVGEGLEQGHLLLGERSCFDAPERDGADGVLLSQEGDG